MDNTSQWPQEMVVKPMDEIIINGSSNSNNNNNNNNVCTKSGGSSSGGAGSLVEKRNRGQVLNCPRCNSTNTKFCYYNNYSLTQPRYFCKTCRRYWTAGGTLRNIPVGGGSRKNKRSSSSSSLTDRNKLPAAVDLINHNPNKLLLNAAQDLNLGFPVLSSGYKSFSDLISIPNFQDDKDINNDLTTTSSALELLNGSQRRLNCYMPPPHQVGDQNGVYTSGFSLPDQFIKSSSAAASLSFSLDGYGSSLQESTSGRLLFPFEDLKVPSTTSTTMTTNIDHHHHHHHVEQNKDINGDHSSGVFWNGVLGGGSW